MRALRYILLATCMMVVLVAGACQQKMASQPSYKPLTRSEFFEDDRSARDLVPGTVARGHLRVDKPLFTGRREFKDRGVERMEGQETPDPRRIEKLGSRMESTTQRGLLAEDDDAFLEEFPFPITAEALRHGYNRYMIYCVVCHDALGTGRGKIVERGFTQPPSFHIERLREAPPGKLFAVVSEGYGAMPSYSAQIPPRDRWAIIAYLRALQLSQHFPVEQLTEEMREELAESVAGRISAESPEPERRRVSEEEDRSTQGVRQIPQSNTAEQPSEGRVP